MAAKAFAGTCYLKVDGAQLALQGDWKVQPNDVERTGVAGPSGVIGFTEKYVVPTIEGTLADGGGVSVQGLAAITASTVTLELVNGKTYILSGAWWAGASPVDAVEGKITVKFEGLACFEQVAS